MTQLGLEDAATTTTPEHCGRPMIAAKDWTASTDNYSALIYWCADCHFKMPRTVADKPAPPKTRTYTGNLLPKAEGKIGKNRRGETLIDGRVLRHKGAD